MLSGVYSAAAALRTAEFQQDVIATNLAHMNVPGFRRSVVSVETFAEQLAAEAANEPGHGNTISGLDTDFSPGPLVDTGRSLDVAIAGDGFFVVQGASESLYTRSGTFHIGEGGVLVGTHGMPVLGENGPMTVPGNVSPSQINIATDGTITAGDNRIGRLQLVRFADNAELKPVGTTLFSAGGAVLADQEVSVIQGVREQSNVEPVDELVAMILAARYHEAAQRTLKSIDDAIQQQTDPQG